MELDLAVLRDWIERFTTAVESNRQYLTALDGPIGDSDHGTNLDRGLRAVRANLATGAEDTLEATMKYVGMTLIRTVGGAAGPLYGTVFLRMAAAIAGRQSLTAADLLAALQAGRQGIVDRGKAAPGDKTMLDTWEPAVRAFEAAVQNGDDLPAAVAAAAAAAEDGMAATIPLVARRGRASYLGERSAGHQDPGATSSYLMFRALHDAVQGG